MPEFNRGDIVRVEGYTNGRQGTILNTRDEGDIVVQMGTATILTRAENILVVSRSNRDDSNNLITPELKVGDKVKWVWLSFSPENVEKYGEIVSFVSEKRVMVKWVGSDTERVERLSRLKWISNYPAFLRS